MASSGGDAGVVAIGDDLPEAKRVGFNIADEIPRQTTSRPSVSSETPDGSEPAAAGGGPAELTPAGVVAEIEAAHWSKVAGIFEALPAELQAHREVATAAVSKSWISFRHTSVELQADRSFILAVMADHGTSALLRCADPHLVPPSTAP